MQLQFYKYQGTGNDFIIIDNRNSEFDRNNFELVAKLCHRRFGIGADGLMLLQNKEGYDFEMVYYNADGNEGSMCGNGGRCIVEFARTLGLAKENTLFYAADGDHEAYVRPGYISLKMQDVNNIEQNEVFCFLNTGSPHYVAFVSDIKNYPVVTEGKKVRYNERFSEQGTNVNYIEEQGAQLFVRTYERGVEDETYSCGTGVTASAMIAAIKRDVPDESLWDIITLGGELKVKFNRSSDNHFTDVWLIGPATFVFKGIIEI